MQAAGLVQPGSAQTTELAVNSNNAPKTNFIEWLEAEKVEAENGADWGAPNGLEKAMTRILEALIYKKATNFHYVLMNPYNFSTNRVQYRTLTRSLAGMKKPAFGAGFLHRPSRTTSE